MEDLSLSPLPQSLSPTLPTYCILHPVPFKIIKLNTFNFKTGNVFLNLPELPKAKNHTWQYLVTEMSIPFSSHTQIHHHTLKHLGRSLTATP